jgi:hypothetical protein
MGRSGVVRVAEFALVPLLLVRVHLLPVADTKLQNIQSSSMLDCHPYKTFGVICRRRVEYGWNILFFLILL